MALIQCVIQPWYTLIFPFGLIVNAKVQHAINSPILLIKDTHLSIYVNKTHLIGLYIRILADTIFIKIYYERQ